MRSVVIRERSRRSYSYRIDDGFLDRAFRPIESNDGLPTHGGIMKIDILERKNTACWIFSLSFVASLQNQSAVSRETEVWHRVDGRLAHAVQLNRWQTSILLLQIFSDRFKASLFFIMQMVIVFESCICIDAHSIRRHAISCSQLDKREQERRHRCRMLNRRQHHSNAF